MSEYTQEEIYKIMDGMEDVYREETKKMMKNAPKCHFRPIRNM